MNWWKPRERLNMVNQGKICSVPGCKSYARVKGLCIRHYRMKEKKACG